MAKFSEMIGKTVLYKVALAAMEGRVIEGTVAKLSDSGNFVGIAVKPGLPAINWWPVESVQVLEELAAEGTPAPTNSVNLTPSATELEATKYTLAQREDQLKKAQGESDAWKARAEKAEAQVAAIKADVAAPTPVLTLPTGTAGSN